MAKILIVGCGAIGTALGRLLRGNGHEVVGLKRSPPPEAQRQFAYFPADIASKEQLERLTCDFDRIFFIVSASRGVAESYHNLYETGVNNLLGRLVESGVRPPCIFVSSTSVYAQSRGEWVDENSPAVGDSPSSRLIVEAEKKIIGFNPASIIVRFSGIYGPGREYLLRQARQQPVVQHTPPYYTNRIHEQDCINVLAFLLARSLAGISLSQCYLASDNEPAPLWEVMNWLTGQMGLEPPRLKENGMDANMNKRCRNAALTNLGYQFLYPDFRAGYGELIRALPQN